MNRCFVFLFLILLTSKFTIYEIEGSETNFQNDCETGVQYNITETKWFRFPIVTTIDLDVPNKVKEATYYYADQINELMGFPVFYIPNDLTGHSIELSVSYRSLNGMFENALAVTALVYNGSEINQIIGTKITVNRDYEFERLPFSCDKHDIGSFDISSVILHELLHVLGLHHVNEWTSSINDGYVGSFQQTLTNGDKNGLFMLYNGTEPFEIPDLKKPIIPVAIVSGLILGVIWLLVHKKVISQ